MSRRRRVPHHHSLIVLKELLHAREPQRLLHHPSVPVGQEHHVGLPQDLGELFDAVVRPCRLGRCAKVTEGALQLRRLPFRGPALQPPRQEKNVRVVARLAERADGDANAIVQERIVPSQEVENGHVHPMVVILFTFLEDSFVIPVPFDRRER